MGVSTGMHNMIVFDSFLGVVVFIPWYSSVPRATQLVDGVHDGLGGDGARWRGARVLKAVDEPPGEVEDRLEAEDTDGDLSDHPAGASEYGERLHVESRKDSRRWEEEEA
ncbi:hypothetical protein B296_00055687 [Ensete ventricosum]|uniref:Uncharacterized protein n=1 Tax=Ensete ventricosum TaxID=4639 RepID=A0A426X2H6_ENSVE|nr:hypothetical protein B296_00055687 [Ensete ventricosum]